MDDPLEAGEPFLDVNSNGKRDPKSHSSISMEAKRTTAPGDQLWANLTAEPHHRVTTRIGVAVPVHMAANGTMYTTAFAGGVRNLEAQGRQRFAQLYCLMLLLVDENYIAPWDENDPQIMTWIETENERSSPARRCRCRAAEADLIVKRKLTCRRMIAQWAVNCVDMRDSDVIMTPFEYDENPWDGWGCPDRNGIHSARWRSGHRRKRRRHEQSDCGARLENDRPTACGRR